MTTSPVPVPVRLFAMKTVQDAGHMTADPTDDLGRVATLPAEPGGHESQAWCASSATEVWESLDAPVSSAIGASAAVVAPCSKPVPLRIPITTDPTPVADSPTPVGAHGG